MTEQQVDPAVVAAMGALLDAAEAAGYRGLALEATIWPNALPSIDGGPRTTHVDAKLTVATQPSPEPITVTVVSSLDDEPGTVPARPLGDTPSTC